MKPALRSFLVGCKFGAIVAVLITVFMPCFVYLVRNNEELSWNLGLFWYVIIMGPAYHFSRALGLDWNDPYRTNAQTTFLGFATTLVVNVLLYAAVAGIIAWLGGWFGRLLERNSVR